jgi:hypothetical protein
VKTAKAIFALAVLALVLMMTLHVVVWMSY